MCLYYSITTVIFRFVFFSSYYSVMVVHGWNNLALQCRDNNNRPVDWWYIYKPPAEVLPDRSGLNFSYITSELAGRWLPSDKYINRDSMMVNTLLPMYKHAYLNRVAVAVYQNRVDRSSRAAARGVLLADEVGGVLLTHTVPGFPGLHDILPSIPPAEAANGHLLSCVSLDLEGINSVAEILRRVSPKFTFIKVPGPLQDFLPQWKFDANVPYVKSSRQPFSVNLKIKGAKRAKIVARPPGSAISLYRIFAELHRIHLNVYGQSRNDYLTTLCSSNFGVRNINTISIKYRDEVYYVTNCTDRSWFAVSTVAHWQQRGTGPTQYWACTSSLDKEDLTGEAGLILCLEEYGIWRTFDNLKVQEPVCKLDPARRTV